MGYAAVTVVRKPATGRSFHRRVRLAWMGALKRRIRIPPGGVVMDPIVLAAGTALVGAIATDTWEQSRAALLAFWRRLRPEQTEAVGEELSDTRAQLLAARRSSDADAEQTLVSDWQLRLQSLIRHNPAAAEELRHLLATELMPALTADERVHIGTLTMKAEASGHARVYQAGHDQHISGD